jgi:hypothetical protein
MREHQLLAWWPPVLSLSSTVQLTWTQLSSSQSISHESPSSLDCSWNMGGWVLSAGFICKRRGCYSQRIAGGN